MFKYKYMNHKTIICLITIIWLSGVFALVPMTARAATLTQAQINAIVSLLQSFGADPNTVSSVQATLSGGAPTVTAAVWCHNFNVNLGVGNSDEDVCALRAAIQKEGFETEDTACKFDEELASAVSGFQQKYVDEILRPSGLRYGTGYVGKATRAKLNKLYGCGVTPLPATPVQACNTFLTCEMGYKPYNTNEKDSQGCPIIKCIPPTTPVTPPVSTVSEQIKCLFHDSTTVQECYSSAGVGCKDTNTCVVDVRGTKGEQITWKSTCGGYSYTTMDGNNEYAEFKCTATTNSTPTLIPTIPTQIQTPIPTTSLTGIGFVRFELLDSSLCPPCVMGTICASCPPVSSRRIYNAKVTLYDEKGILIGTKDTSGGTAVFENLAYGNYTATFSAPGFETDKLLVRVAPNTGTDYSVNLKKSSTNQPPTITEVIGPNTLKMYETGTWTVKASDSEQGILTYTVSWGDSQQTASGYNPTTYTQTATFSHIYDYTGTYQITFTVTDDKGLSVKTGISVNVGEVPPPSITLISPNGGEVFKLGSTYNVVWKSSNVTRVVLDLVDSTGKIFIYKNLVNVSGNPGSASWTIPTYVEPGQYWMRIGTCSVSVTNCTTTGAEDPVTIFDISDAAFSIVSIIY